MTMCRGLGRFRFGAATDNAISLHVGELKFGSGLSP